ncbi:hypothetical protein [Kribbella sp. NPDC055071]
MFAVDGVAYDDSSTPDGVSWSMDAGVARVVIGGTFGAAAAAAVRELLLDLCEPGSVGLVLAIEAVVDPADYEELCHLADTAQRRCWVASCRLEVTATDPGAREALAAAGWGAVQRR